MRGVDDLESALNSTQFFNTLGESSNYGVIVQYEKDIRRDDYGSANSNNVFFNKHNIDARIKEGYSQHDINKAVAIHEIGHTLGGKDNDGTSVMRKFIFLQETDQLGNPIGQKFNVPSVTPSFTRHIMELMNIKKQSEECEGRLWTARD